MAATETTAPAPNRYFHKLPPPPPPPDMVHSPLNRCDLYIPAAGSGHDLVLEPVIDLRAGHGQVQLAEPEIGVVLQGLFIGIVGDEDLVGFGGILAELAGGIDLLTVDVRVTDAQNAAGPDAH